jgi:hypothetical protein
MKALRNGRREFTFGARREGSSIDGEGEGT